MKQTIKTIQLKLNTGRGVIAFSKTRVGSTSGTSESFLRHTGPMLILMMSPRIRVSVTFQLMKTGHHSSSFSGK